ncbi:hypothetical protein [Pseudomonas fluorescens]|uniref:Dermonecrotic toxin n=1 Tax=Pseudomonas fluorescens TaxID=294 RepID=A0AAE2U316_PSEFL|nr:hypothetical protein [Pseudomonas fluorescens]MBD8268959.1 hypothetical protein [Pseudomonas fluorescens]
MNNWTRKSQNAVHEKSLRLSSTDVSSTPPMISSRPVIPLQQRPSHTPEKTLTRHLRSAEHESATVAVPENRLATAQTTGDSELAVLLAQAMRAGANTGELHDIENIPPASTFGQWWSHLHNVMQSRHFLLWAQKQPIDLSKPIYINHKANSIEAMVGGQRKSFSGFEHGHLWTSMMAPIMRAASALTSSSGYICSPASSTWAPYRAVADFYGEALSGQTRASMAARATELEHSKAFASTPADSERCAEILQDEKAKLANVHDQKNVASKLIDILLKINDLPLNTTRSPLEPKYVSPSAAEDRIEQLIRDQMRSIHLSLHADSPFKVLQEGHTVSLEKYCSDNGWNMPKNRDELFNLGRTFDRPPLAQLSHGNFGGALSWPTPLSDEDQDEIKNTLRQNSLGISGLQNYDENTGVLGYLTHNQHFATYELHNPAQFIQNLLTTPKAQALGLALQDKFGGVSTPQSVNDWTLAALGITLGQDCEATNTSAAVRTSIAGFDMARSEHWDKHPSALVSGLVNHLVATGRASAELAPIAAHLLLSPRAPAFLVKDIPDKVSYGSHTWVSFSTAVARLEHEAPGSTANMTYAQVMQRADLAPITDQELQVEYRAQRDALKDWGVAHGVIPRSAVDAYTDEQMSRVYSEYNTHVAALREASQTYSTPFPERRVMALEALKAVYGDLEFEKKCITPLIDDRDRPGPYSVLDLFLKGHLNSLGWVSSSDDIDIDRIVKDADKLPNINGAFNAEIANYFPAMEKAMATQVKHLITTLPLEDRKAIEYGKITPLAEYDVSYTYYSQVRVETKVPHRLLLKTELDGITHVHEVDLKQNSIRKRDELKNHPTGRRTSTEEKHRYKTMLLEVRPSGGYPANITDEKPAGGTPKSFSSERSRYIADTLVEDTDIRALESQARGLTTFDTEVPFYQNAREFLLNLIPLRSAILNFQAGNVREGALDLLFDAFGFAVAIGAAAKGAKLLQAGLSAANRITQGVKILGRAALGSLNPLSGIDDLARGLVNGGRKAFSKVNNLQLIAASRKNGIVATGTFKYAEQTIDGCAVLHNKKWYAYNPVNGRPYGKPLAMFTPDNVAMGGKIETFKMLANDAGISTDTTKRGLRLTVDAHGVIPPGHSSALMQVGGAPITPNELLDLLKAKNIDLSKYVEVRLTMCDSATGGAQSFAAQFSKLSKKPTEGFKGIMYTSSEVENIAVARLKNGGAKQQELINDTVIDTKKTITKYQPTGMTDDGRFIYTQHPDYNPVHFDAQGQPMPNKPPRKPYSPEPVKPNESSGGQTADIDFSEYDDLT